MLISIQDQWKNGPSTYLNLGKTIKSKCLYSSLVSMSGKHFVDQAYIKKKCKVGRVLPSALIRTITGRLGGR